MTIKDQTNAQREPETATGGSFAFTRHLWWCQPPHEFEAMKPFHGAPVNRVITRCHSAMRNSTGADRSPAGTKHSQKESPSRTGGQPLRRRRRQSSTPAGPGISRTDWNFAKLAEEPGAPTYRLT